MLQSTLLFPDYQFVVAGVNTIKLQYYSKLIKNFPVKVVIGKTHDLLRVSRAAVVKSGTVTLETAMLGIPEVVVYRFSFLTALIAWMLVHVKYISLVNLILDRKAVAELIQYKFTSKSLFRELAPLLPDGEPRSRMLNDYKELLHRVGPPGASDRAAEIMVNKMKLVNNE